MRQTVTSKVQTVEGSIMVTVLGHNMAKSVTHLAAVFCKQTRQEQLEFGGTKMSIQVALAKKR